MRGQSLSDPEKMAKALDAGFRRLKWARDSYSKNCKERAGRHYGSKKDNKPRPVNLISQYVDTLTPNLLNQRPRHTVKTRVAELRGEAELLAMALDMLWDDMNLVERMQDLIQDALLAPFAIAKIGLRAGQDIIKEGEAGANIGQPYVRRVSPDDFNADPAARSVEEACWFAHRYRISREYAQDSGIYDPDKIMSLATIQTSKQTDGNRSADLLSVGADNRFEGLDIIELWDVAYRQEDKWLIGTTSAAEGQFRREWLNADGGLIEYDGDANGPYEILTFHRIPDNLPGLSPSATWMDLHESIDKLYWKMIRQALRAKNVQVSSRLAHDDAITINNAADGDHLEVDNIDQHKEMNLGGVNKDAYPFIDSLMSMWNNAAGNMQLLSGGGLQTDKATGQSILQANAQTRLGFMKEKTARFGTRIAKRLGMYLLTDPTISLPLPYRTAGGQVMTLQYDAAERQGGPMGAMAMDKMLQAQLAAEPGTEVDTTSIEEEARAHFSIEIDQSTMVGQDPELALKRKIEAIGVMGSVGVQFDPIGLSRQIGRDLGWTDMDEVVLDPAHAAAMQQAILGAPAMPGMAPGGPTMPPGGGPPQLAGTGPAAKAQAGQQAYGRGAEMRGVA